MLSDPELRGLGAALDPARMLPFVARAVGLDPDDTSRLHCEASVVTHKPGRRCVIRYSLRNAGRRATEPVFGKVYVSRRRATLMHRRHEALRRSGIASMPACLLLVEPAHLVLQQSVDGTPLDRLLEAPDVRGPLSGAARWLASLHGTPPLPDLKRVPIARSLEKAGLWCTGVGRQLGIEAGSGEILRDALARVAGSLPATGLTMIHRDFQPAHVLRDAGRIWVLDFDELCIGDPALDVGHFLAQLAFEGWRRTGSSTAFADLGEHFLRGYREASPLQVQERVPFYRAYTFLKLADQQARRRASGWRSSCAALLDLARHELARERLPGG